MDVPFPMPYSCEVVSHLRQAKGKAGLAATFTEDMKLTMKKKKTF